MLGFVMLSAISAAENAWREEQAFQEMLRTLSPEDRNMVIAEREKQRCEEVEERRHREKCEAIRSTSFWRFGS